MALLRLVVGLLAGGVFLVAIGGEATLPDLDLLVGHPQWRDGWGAAFSLREGPQAIGGGFFRPLALLWMRWSLGEGADASVRLAHASAILLHVLASLAFLELIRRSSARLFAAGAWALLFCVHPIHVEAVAHVSAFPALAANTLMLAALALGWGVGEAPHAALRRLAALGLLVLGTLCHELAFVGFGIFALAERKASPQLGASRGWLPYAVAALLALALRIFFVGAMWPSPDPAANPLVDAPIWLRVLNLARLVLFQLYFLLNPWASSPDHGAGALPLATDPWDPAWLVLPALVALGALGWRRLPAVHRPRAWLALSLLALPLLYLLPVPAVSAPLVSERLLTLPFAGLLLGASLAASISSEFLSKWLSVSRARALGGLLAALCVAVGAITSVNQVGFYRDGGAFVEAILSRAPRSALGHFYGARVLIDQAMQSSEPPIQQQLGRRAAREVILAERSHSFGAAGSELMVEALRLAGDPDGALRVVEIELKRRPEDRYWRRLQASVAAEGGHSAKAEALFERLLDERPEDIEALSGLASVHSTRGETSKAIALLERALAVAPPRAQRAVLLNNLAVVYERAGDEERARELFRRALETEPRLPISAASLGEMGLEAGESLDPTGAQE